MAKVKPPVRYAVVGTGWFAQAAILPAFEHAENSKLVAIISGDPVKRQELGERYSVAAVSYEECDTLLSRGEVDAVYIATPNALHGEYVRKAANHRVHVLCEKPLAADAKEAKEMVKACKRGRVKLMTAYRLHFEAANLAAIEAVRSGKIGEPRMFTSTFAQNVTEGNTRLEADLAGKASPLLDMGIYCINAARYLFQDDPIEVMGFSASNDETRFSEVPEMVSAVMRFPKERLANFTCGFGESKVSEFRLVGTTGDIRMDPAYGFDADLKMSVTVNDDTSDSTFRRRDQVGAEIQYFSGCILNNRNPEPDGFEGLADLMVIEAIQQSAKTGRRVKLKAFRPKRRPLPQQEISLSPVKQPELVNAAPPGADD
ncbi:MAG: Gfo/Idh/MocA family oxidoreductase [Gemmataceae bacterium]